MNKPSNYIGLILGLAIASVFVYFIYKFLPLGIALVITGGCLATLSRVNQDKVAYYIGIAGSWLYPVGIIITFLQNGWVLGILSVILGFLAYRYAKHS